MRLKAQIWMAAFCTALSLQAQTNGPTKPISLQECIRLALENNFTVAIERYRPRLAAYALGGSYSYYDPVFEARAEHFVSSREGEFDPGFGLNLPGGEDELDRLQGGLTGRLWPTGLRYDISSEFRHETGTRFGELSSVNEVGQNRVVEFGFIPYDTYRNDLNIVLEQPLLRDFWIDADRLAIKLRKKDIKISEYQLLGTVMDIVRQVQQTYYQLIAARETVKARQKGVELAERLVSENRKRIEVGTMAPLDEKQAESEAALRRAELIDAQREVTREENVLKNLISNQYQQWYSVTLLPTEALLVVPQTYDIQESWLNALNLRPDFNRIKEEMERQGLQVKYDFNQLFPFLNLVGTYGRRGLDELSYTTDSFRTTNGLRVREFSNLRRVRDSSFSGSLHDIGDNATPYYSYGMVLRFPLTFRQERYNYRTAKALEDQLKLQVQQLHQNILVGIDDAIKAAQSAYELVQATRNAREFAEEALDAEQRKLDNGRSTSFNVLQLQEDTTDRRALEIGALAEYNIALSQLYFLEGRILEKNKVKVEVTNGP